VGGSRRTKPPTHSVGNLNKIYMKINTFTLKGKDIEMIFNNGFLAYSFKHDDKPYSQKIKIESRSVMSISAVTFLLLENALATIEKLHDK